MTQAPAQLTPEQFENELNEKLLEIAEFCKEYWGDAPELETTVRPAMLASCNFDLGDFPHRGRTFLIHTGNAQRRSPQKVAQQIMQEVCSHRNKCDRCGLGIPPIMTRLSRLESAVRRGDEHAWARTNIDQFAFPADEPERMLFPRQAKRLDAALAAMAALNG